MKAALVVMGHRAVQDTIDRHMPYWRRTGLDILGTNPQDGTIWPADVESMAYGVNAHCGRDSAVRLLNVFKWIANSPERPFYCVIEYDMLVLKPYIPPSNVVYTHSDVNKEGDRFKHKFYNPPPWIVTNKVASVIHQTGEKLLNYNDFEEGYNDRFIARILSKSGLFWWAIPNVHHGYFDKDPEAKRKALEAVKAGTCTFLHCVKTQADLDYFGL